MASGQHSMNRISQSKKVNMVQKYRCFFSMLRCSHERQFKLMCTTLVRMMQNLLQLICNDFNRKFKQCLRKL
jgi:hypothetical protein